MEIPDELYRQAKAKSALEGRPIREVAIELFSSYVAGSLRRQPKSGDNDDSSPVLDREPTPAWFGILRDKASRVASHDLDAIRESIARGTVRRILGDRVMSEMLA